MRGGAIFVRSPAVRRRSSGSRLEPELQTSGPPEGGTPNGGAWGEDSGTVGGQDRIRIGSAWAHADGNGFNIQLETVPLNGPVALRIATEKNK